MRVRINVISISNVRNLFYFFCLNRSRHGKFTDLFKLYKSKIINPPLFNYAHKQYCINNLKKNHTCKWSSVITTKR